jgi:hypothetical protein
MESDVPNITYNYCNSSVAFIHLLKKDTKIFTLFTEHVFHFMHYYNKATPTPTPIPYISDDGSSE